MKHSVKMNIVKSPEIIVSALFSLFFFFVVAVVEILTLQKEEMPKGMEQVVQLPT